MTVLESYIERKVIAWAKVNGWFFRKLQWIGRDGAPDRFFLRQARHVFIEFKRPGKKPTEIQQREIDRMRAEGAEVWVVDSIEEGIRILTRRPNYLPWLEDDFV